MSVEGEYFMSQEFLAHKDGVNAILVMGDGTIVTGGVKDRKLSTWDSAIDFAKKFETKLPEGVGSVRSLSKQSVDQSSRDSAVYIGNLQLQKVFCGASIHLIRRGGEFLNLMQ